MASVLVAARRYRHFVLLGALVVTVVAGAFAVAAATARTSFHGTGAAGTPVAIQGAVVGGEGADLDVYAAPAPDPDDPPRCTSEAGAVFDDPGYSTRLSHDGRDWVRVGHLKGGWRAGQTVTCSGTGVDQVLLVHDARARWRVFAVGLAAGAILLWLFTIAVFAMARNARDARS